MNPAPEPLPSDAFARSRVWRYRRLWLPDLLALLVAMAATTLLFRVTDLDVRLARVFYSTATGEPAWPWRQAFPWKLLYDYGTWPGLGVAIGAAAVFVLSFFRPRLHPYRLHSAFLILALAVGPGLLVNTIFKDHWGRPRPSQTTEFGGYWPHEKVWDRGVSGRGKSFPCGHSSMGFYFAAFYFLCRRRRRALGIGALLFALLYGTLIGIARMAAGSHFASDVLWSFYFSFLAALLLYYFLFRLPAIEDGASSFVGVSRGTRPFWIALCIFMLLGIAAALVLGTPMYKDIDLPLPPHPRSSGEATTLRIDCPQGNVEVLLGRFPLHPVRVRGTAHGFGWPGSRLLVEASDHAEPGSLQRRVGTRIRGYFAELDVDLRVEVDADAVSTLDVRIGEGNLILRADKPDLRLPELHPEIREGYLFVPEDWAGDKGPLGNDVGMPPDRIRPAVPLPAPASVPVAAIQCHTRMGETEYNRTLLAGLIRQAAGSGARFVVMPECAVSGYMDPVADRSWTSTPGGEEANRPDVALVAERVPGPSTAFFGALARELNLYLALSLVEREGHRFFNSQVLLDPTGTLIAHHRKKSLWPPGDGAWASPGDRPLQVVTTPWGRIGLMICYDIHDLPEPLGAAKTDIVLYSVGWYGPNTEDWYRRVVPTRYVVTNGFSLVAANWSAEDEAPGWPGCGYSCILRRDGTVLNMATNEHGSAVVVAEIVPYPEP